MKRPLIISVFDPTPTAATARHGTGWVTLVARLPAKNALCAGARAVEACEWFPQAVSVHGGLSIQHACQ